MVAAGEVDASDLQIATVDVALVERHTAVGCHLLVGATPLRGNDSQKTPNMPGKGRMPPCRVNGSTPEAVLPRKVAFCSLALRIVA